MKDLQIFNNPQFGDIRTVTSSTGEPLFCLADVCRSLDLTNVTEVRKRLSQKGFTTIETLTSGGVQHLGYISEANLYKCIFQSRKPDAEKFQDWICEDVLPSIRKHGAYITPQTIENILNNPDFGIQLLSALKEERSRRIEVEAQNKEIQPKVIFTNAVTASKRSCLIGELAKILNQNGVNIGQNRLFKWLRSNGYLCKKGEYYNQPAQKAMDLGLFEIKKTVINKPDGSKFMTSTTKVTGIGQIYFVNKFL